MPIIGVQGLRGGVGTTSMVAGLGWAFQQLAEPTLLIDGTPDNLLRLFFNVAAPETDGWARALLDQRRWQATAWRYLPGLDLLPTGSLTPPEQALFARAESPLRALTAALRTLRQSDRWRWIVLDLAPFSTGLNAALFPLIDHLLLVARPDASCHVHLHQRALPDNAVLLINGLLISSTLQNQLQQIWQHSALPVAPVVIHHDEAIAECLAAKCPPGEYAPSSLAVSEILTLANWCLLNFRCREALCD